MIKFKTPTMALSVFLVLIMSVTLDAQLMNNFGKMQVNDGRLNFVVNPNSSMRISSTQTGTVTKTIRFERTESGAKLDIISKSVGKIQALRINDNDIFICIRYINSNDSKKEETKKNKNGIQFFHSIELTSLLLNPMLAVTDDKSENKKSEKTKQYPAVLVQKDSTPIRLLIQTDDTTLLEYQSRSIWDLIIIVPSKHRQTLFDLLQVYDSNTFSDESGLMLQICSAISKISNVNVAQQKEYQQLVDALSSDVYMKRVIAMSRIEQEGQSFIQYAKKIDLNKLDLEARVCLTNLLNVYSNNSDMDSLENLSRQFMGMNYAYILLLELGVDEYVQDAQKILKEKLGDKFEYDTKADESVRSQQIEVLKNALQCPKANVIQMDDKVQKNFQKFTEELSDVKKSEFKFNP